MILYQSLPVKQPLPGIKIEKLFRNQQRRLRTKCNLLLLVSLFAIIGTIAITINCQQVVEEQPSERGVGASGNFVKRAVEYRRRVTLAKRPPTTTVNPPPLSSKTSVEIESDDNKESSEDADAKENQAITNEESQASGDDEDEKDSAEKSKSSKSSGEKSDDYEMDEEYVRKSKKTSPATKKPAKVNANEDASKKAPSDADDDYESPPTKTSTRKPQKTSKSSQKPKASTTTSSSSNPTSRERENVRRKSSKTTEATPITSKPNKYEFDEEKSKENDGLETSDSDDTRQGDEKENEGEEQEERIDVKQSAGKDEAESWKQKTSKISSPISNVTRKALVKLPFIKPKNESACTPEAYLEFPHDLIGNKWRSRGLVIIHIAVVCYMFYSLALVCEKYFMPSLQEFSQRLNLSQDVAGATLMSAGSSAPELFTAILGVFIAKGDVGTGAIVGSAVFNILFVIGICAFVCTSPTQLNWWPVLRDSVYYCITVLVLILFIYDERVTALESFTMIALYGIYILIMSYNDSIRLIVTNVLLSNPNTAKLISVAPKSPNDEVFCGDIETNTTTFNDNSTTKKIEEDSMFLAACLVIIQHKRLFRSQLRFKAAAHYIIIKRQHRIQQAALRQQQQQSQKQIDEVNYFGPEEEPLTRMSHKDKVAASQKQRIEAYASNAAISKNKFSIVSRDDYEFWNRPPQEGENYYLWLAKIPVNYVLHYTVPDCVLYPDKYLLAFFMSIFWTAFFSYVNVWMVTLIGYTFGIPDSVMGFTFLAAGTSVPDCYSSIHAAKNGMADMAVSNSIGSNVFDILVGLAVPWFIQSAIYPGVTATINSRGIVYSVILLFLSLIVTIYLMNKYEWTLKPRLGLALLIAYALFIALTCMLEFNLFGFVNPPPCIQPN